MHGAMADVDHAAPDGAELDDVFDFGDASSGCSDGSDVALAAGGCVRECALFESDLEHRLYHLFGTGHVAPEFPLPAVAVREELDPLFPGSFMLDAEPSFHVSDHLAHLLDEDELQESEQDLRLLFSVGGASCSFSDGGPALWLDLVQSFAPLGQLVLLARSICVALQSHIDSACPGVRVWPTAFRSPFPSASAMRQQGCLALEAMDFALELPIADGPSLASLVRAVLRAPCALRGAVARPSGAGFALALFFAPLEAAERAGLEPPAQSAAVRGNLFVPAVDADVAEAASHILEEEVQKAPAPRRRRRGR